MRPEKYLTKQRKVEAVQVTKENMAEVAEWCGGTIYRGESTWIAANWHRPQNQRQKEGHVGDWIVKQGGNFKVFLDAPFKFGFEPDHKGVHIENVPAEIPYVVNSTEPTPLYEEIRRNPVGVPKPAPGAYGHVPIQHDPQID